MNWLKLKLQMQALQARMLGALPTIRAKARKALRFVVALPIALPLIVLGWLLMKVWPPFCVLLLVGVWLLGGDMPVVG